MRIITYGLKIFLENSSTQGVIVKYVYIFPEPEEKKRRENKWNRDHKNFPEIGLGDHQVGKIS